MDAKAEKLSLVSIRAPPCEGATMGAQMQHARFAVSIRAPPCEGATCTRQN